MTPFHKNLPKITEPYQQKKSIEFPKTILIFVATIIKIIEGHTTQKLLPMWVEIFESPFKRKMVLAARQTGKTTYIGIKLLFKSLFAGGKTSNYVTYDETNLSHFSNEKFRRGLIGYNPIVKTQITKNDRGEVAFENGSTINLVTDEGEYKHVEGTSAEYNAFDEIQYQDLQFLVVAFETQSWTQGEMDFLGRGGEAGSEYERMWNSTDQAEWEFDNKTWRDNLQFGPEGLIIGDYLDEVLKGKWVRKKPQNAQFPGFHLPQTIFPHIPLTIEDAIMKYKTAPEFSLEWKRKNYPKFMFQAHVLAEFYKAVRRPITEEMVRACMDNYRAYSFAFFSPEFIRDIKAHYGKKAVVLMGVDWGSGTSGNSSTVIVILLKIRTGHTDDTARYFLVYLHKVDRGEPGEPEQGIDEAHFVVKKFQEYYCDYGVADLGYGEIQVKAIQDGGINPRTGEKFQGLKIYKFMGCRTIQDIVSPEQDRLGKTDEEVDEVTRLQIDKTHAIDNFVNFIEWHVSNPAAPTVEYFRRPKLAIPYGNDLDVEWLIKDWTSITRKDLEKIIDVAKEDPRQMPKKEYNHPPDSAMGVIYAMVADTNFKPGGADFGGAFRSTRKR